MTVSSILSVHPRTFFAAKIVTAALCPSISLIARRTLIQNTSLFCALTLSKVMSYVFLHQRLMVDSEQLPSFKSNHATISGKEQLMARSRSNSCLSISTAGLPIFATFSPPFGNIKSTLRLQSASWLLYSAFFLSITAFITAKVAYCLVRNMLFK